MERPLGSKFAFRGIELIVVKNDTENSTCTNCYFKRLECMDDDIGECGESRRTDRTDIIFKRVK